MRVVHLDPREPLPGHLVVVGDPGRAARISRLLRDVRVVNEKRGYTVYAGYWGGRRLGVGVHGIGGPSTAIFVEESLALGSRVYVRLGTCGSLGPVEPGDVVVVTRARPLHGGVERAYLGRLKDSHPEGGLVGAIREELRARGIGFVEAPVLSSDAYYAEGGAPGGGYACVEMECSTLFLVTGLRGAASACVLIVSNYSGDAGSYLDPGVLEGLEKALAEALFTVLARM